MRINALATAPTAPPRAPAPRAAAPASAEPRDVAQTSFRTAEDVLRLPILDPVFQLGMAMGTLSAMMGGAGGSAPQVALRLASTSAEQGTQAEYLLDMEHPETPVTGRGLVGGEPLNETARLEQGQLLWHGNLGKDTVDFHMGLDENRECFTMKGQAGALEADLSVAFLASEQDDFEGIRTTGRLAGQPYSVDTLIRQPEGGLHAGGEPGRLEVRGHVNGKAIHRDYLVTVERASDGFALRASGSGVTAGLQQEMDVQVQVRDRRQAE